MSWTEPQLKDRKKALDDLTRLEAHALAKINDEVSQVHDALGGASRLDGVADAVKGPIDADVKVALEHVQALKSLSARVAAQLKHAIEKLK